MFKVVCIDSDFNVFKAGTYESVNKPPNWEVFVGEIYTVAEVVITDRADLYIFNERNYKYRYNSKKFIPLSNIDETEFERNYNIEKIKL